MHNLCYEGAEQEAFCRTRTWEDEEFNSTFNYDKWGYCADDCKGQKIGPNSTYNIAREEFGRVWEENLFNLKSYGAGHCYTYNPPKKSESKFENRLFMMLGNQQIQKKIKNNFNGFDVYLHEKGHFWPRPGMSFIGQSKAIKIGKMKEIIGQFLVTKSVMINRPKICTASPGYSFTKCMFDYIHRTIKCNISLNSEDQSLCPMNVNLKKYQDILLYLQQASFNNLTEETGCVPKCKYDTYEFEEEASENVDWKVDWISSFYLMPKSASLKLIEEKYEYGYSDLMADFGSYLGLFLGWSLLTITRDIPAGFRWWQNIFKTMISKCKPKDTENAKPNN